MAERNAQAGSPICGPCPACGATDIRTRMVTAVLAECVCRVCRFSWSVSIEPMEDAR
ncbi:MAG TPA: hypothetical protein VNI83_12790 [Vicinamibacterales bacterium]|nr:hypothetical protein [Vicinamibacterales bacterium]